MTAGSAPACGRFAPTPGGPLRVGHPARTLSAALESLRQSPPPALATTDVWPWMLTRRRPDAIGIGA